MLCKKLDKRCITKMAIKYIVNLFKLLNNITDSMAAHTEKQYPQSNILWIKLNILNSLSNKNFRIGWNISDLTASSVIASVQITAAIIFTIIIFITSIPIEVS